MHLFLRNIIKYQVIILLLILTSCVSQEQRDAAEIAQCTDLGFKPKTTEFGNCRLQLKSIQAQDKTARATAYGAIMQNSNANKMRTCNMVGNTMQCF